MPATGLIGISRISHGEGAGGIPSIASRSRSVSSWLNRGEALASDKQLDARSEEVSRGP